MIRLLELVPIPDPYPPTPRVPIGHDTLQGFRVRVGLLVTVCLRSGVLNTEDAQTFLKKTNEVLKVIRDLEHRLNLRESIDYGELDDLRFRWKQEYRGFLKFRDTIRYTLNILTQNELISVDISDNVKTEIDRLYGQIIEIDRTVQSVLRNLGRS